MAFFDSRCRIWELDIGNFDEREKVKKGFRNLKNPNISFAIDFEGGFADINDKTNLIIAGEDLAAPMGYLRYVNHGNIKRNEIDLLVKKEIMGSCERAEIYRMQDLNYSLTEEFKGGIACKISLMESFYPRKGYGQDMIKYLQNKDGVKLLYVSASSDAVLFYLKQGFFHLGLRMGCNSKKCIKGLLSGCGIWDYIPMAWIKREYGEGRSKREV